MLNVSQEEYEIFKEVRYKVIGSGSKGNSVVIGNVMVDCGLPFKKLQPYLYDVEYLLLTHTHGDHIRQSTYDRIKKMFPKIITIGNHEVHQIFGVDIIANSQFPVITKDYTFHPFEVKHDVLCYGFHWEGYGEEIFYVTDAAELPEFAEDYRASILFLESNHSEEKVKAAAKSGKNSYHSIFGSSRHLSHKQSRLFYFMHREDKDTPWIELHKSEKFY